MRDQDDSSVPYFLLGLGLGAALGVLFAPKAGAETRRIIRDKAEESADYLKRRGDELRESANDAMERGKQHVTKRKEHFSAAVDAGRQAYREALQPDAE
jgi:gas vesicle protein